MPLAPSLAGKMRPEGELSPQLLLEPLLQPGGPECPGPWPWGSGLELGFRAGWVPVVGCQGNLLWGFLRSQPWKPSSSSWIPGPEIPPATIGAVSVLQLILGQEGPRERCPGFGEVGSQRLLGETRSGLEAGSPRIADLPRARRPLPPWVPVS